MKKFLCRIGIHWMKNHRHNFIDKVSGKTVYNAECECGIKWMVDSLLPFWGFRIMREQDTKGATNDT